MAVELFSETSSISPRISFSRDFSQSDAIPIEQRPLRSSPSSKPSSLHSSVDFDFCIPGGVTTGESFDQASWSADELFCNGKILPTEIKKKPESARHKPGRTDPAKREADRPETRNSQRGRTKPEKQGNPVLTRDETVGNDDDVIISSTAAEEKPNTKSFWGFKRSSSLNCGSGYGRSLCPLPLLSRSNSTGSTSTVGSGVNKQKHSSKKQTEAMKIHQFGSSSSLSSNSSSHSQKPPLKKNYGGYIYGKNGGVGGGIRVNPVLNVVPPGNLFGLGSIFAGSGRDKNKKR